MLQRIVRTVMFGRQDTT